LRGLDGYLCLQGGTGLTTGTGTVAFPLWVVPAETVGQRKKPARKSTNAATGGFVCANRVCCVFVSRPSRTVFMLSGRSPGRIISTRRKDLTLARSTAQRLSTYQSRYRELVTQLGDVGHIAVPLSRPARRLPAPIRGDLPCQLADTGGPIRLPGEKSHEPCSTHARRPPRNRDWLLRCLSSGFGCLLS
jgi:hypothetical protein